MEPGILASKHVCLLTKVCYQAFFEAIWTTQRIYTEERLTINNGIMSFTSAYSTSRRSMKDFTADSYNNYVLY